MASTIGSAPHRRPVSLAPDRLERALAYAAIVLFAAVLIAIVRGSGQWHLVPATIWAHLATVMIALALTPVMLLGRRATKRHRVLGTIWVVAMIGSAAISLFVHTSGPGRFSPIHIISIWVLIQVPVIWYSARTHNIAKHRGTVRGMVIGALLIAGFFTFPFNRLLGHWLFG